MNDGTRIAFFFTLSPQIRHFFLFRQAQDRIFLLAAAARPAVSLPSPVIVFMGLSCSVGSTLRSYSFLGFYLVVPFYLPTFAAVIII